MVTDPPNAADDEDAWENDVDNAGAGADGRAGAGLSGLSVDARLLPNAAPTQDLFICDVGDAVLKDIVQHMEHPFYSLSKKPETSVRRYVHGAHWLEVIPSVKGLATIYDKDILIYAISQIMAKLRRGEPVGKRVRLNSHEFLAFSGRGAGGKDYKALVESLERLRGTTISTNIRSGDAEQVDTFGLIESSSVRRNFGLDGRLRWVELTLSDWVFNAIRNQEVLTLHPGYFKLRKPMERRIYELARKHCGQQRQWRCGIETLLKKSGSKSPLKQFRYLLKDIAESDHLPDYRIELEEGGEVVRVVSRGTVPEATGEAKSDAAAVRLSPGAHAAARAAAPGWDVRALEAEWRAWMADGGFEAPRDPDRAFAGFCAKWFERRGRP